MSGKTFAHDSPPRYSKLMHVAAATQPAPDYKQVEPPPGTTNGKAVQPPLSAGLKKKESLPPAVQLWGVGDSTLDYGWLNWQPKSLQVLNKPHFLLMFMCVSVVAQGMIVNGFVGTAISTIEKRFDLNSKQTGMIAGMYDAAVVIVLFFVCQYGGYGHKGRWIGIGVLIMGLGSFVFALPHMFVDKYVYEADNKTLAMCADGEMPESEDCTPSYLTNYIYLFLLGQLLHGIGASPMFTLGVTYIDENVSQKMSPIYIGIYYAVGVIGPALGYILGGVFLNIYGEVGRMDISKITISSDDPRWYGAWWIGPLITSGLAIISAVPILGYARELPGSKERKVLDMVETHQNAAYKQLSCNPGFGRKLRDIPASLKILFTNPAYMCVVLCMTCEGFLLGGFITFVPKYLENQFNITAGEASIMAGSIVVSAGSMGTVLGGWLIKRLKLLCAGILKLALLCLTFSCLGCIGLLIRCPNIHFAGVTQIYQSNLTDLPQETNLSAGCNIDCGCSMLEYKPVCGIDHVSYFSPCFAGCKEQRNGGYASCSCLNLYEMQCKDENGYALDDCEQNGQQLPKRNETSLTARKGFCPGTCQLMTPFIFVFIFMCITSLVASIPMQQAVLRTVPFTQRSMAIGIQWISVRVLGTIPGPIIFGIIIDNACLLWQEQCNEKTSCLQYDNPNMSIRFMVLALCVKAAGVVFIVTALRLYHPPTSSPTQPAAAAAGKTSDDECEPSLAAGGADMDKLAMLRQDSSYMQDAASTVAGSDSCASSLMRTSTTDTFVSQASSLCSEKADANSLRSHLKSSVL